MDAMVGLPLTFE